ncbi:MAG: SAM-dependent methyltransferase [Ardenticatenaceae bacterium]|nr:SAM-dependent methyltransferase [Ardenticatenaceae bacterium]
MLSINQLASTAFWTASVRALESQQAAPLFHDPWAAALAGAEGAAWIANRPPDSVIPIILRTRYFDDFLERITQQENIRQVVLLAAGLDTRAFRLNWPEQTRLFELDQADVLAHKEAVLQSAGGQPRSQRQVIPIDLTTNWPDVLLHNGFDPQTPSLWLLEGFLFYLAHEVTTPLLDAVTSLAAPGSWLGFDVVNTPTLTSPLTQKWVAMQAAAGAPWVGTMDDPIAFLAARGWQASLTQAGAADAHYGRWPFPIIPVTMPNMPHNWYVTAQKMIPDAEM